MAFSNLGQPLLHCDDIANVFLADHPMGGGCGMAYFSIILASLRVEYKPNIASWQGGALLGCTLLSDITVVAVVIDCGRKSRIPKPGKIRQANGERN